jgi:hypothetical protein
MPVVLVKSQLVFVGSYRRNNNYKIGDFNAARCCIFYLSILTFNRQEKEITRVKGLYPYKENSCLYDKAYQ